MRRLLLALVLPLAACDAADPCASGCSSADEIVDGVNLTRLFSPAVTADERAAVAASWAARDAAATATALRPRLEPVAQATDATGAGLTVWAAFPRSGARETLFVAAVREPRRTAGDVRARPLFLVLPDVPVEGGSVDAGALPLQWPLADAWADEVVMATVAPRGTTLLAGGRAFGAGVAVGDAYLTDVSDALTLATADTTLSPMADLTRLGVSGHGRGGTTALAMAARRLPGLGLAVSTGTPTSFVTAGVRDEARRWLADAVLRWRIPALPDVLAATVGAVRSGAVAPADARLALLERSPGPFVVPPPFVVAAHGVLDSAVPSEQLSGLTAIREQPDAVALLLDEIDHDGIVRHPEVVELATARARTAFGWP